MVFATSFIVSSYILGYQKWAIISIGVFIIVGQFLNYFQSRRNKIEREDMEKRFNIGLKKVDSAVRRVDKIFSSLDRERQ